MGLISVVVVTFESSETLGRCLGSLSLAAPERGVRVVVVDNASTDGSAAMARRYLPASQVITLSENRGFSAGVNAGLAQADSEFVAVFNPDTVVAPGSLDTLADVLDACPHAGLVAPFIVRPGGTPESSVGRFPSPATERSHALGIDALFAQGGRGCPFPRGTGPVDWASGCAWLLRAEAARQVGPLDERFFMYFEDVDYCSRLWSAGWQVLATRRAEVVHDTGHGSRITATLAADGGLAAPRYFEKHFSPSDAAHARRWLLVGWRLRAVAHAVAASMGYRASAGRARRFRQSLALARRAS